MDLKPRPNHDRYLQILRSMSPEKKLRKVFELQDMARELCLSGLRHRHPEMTEPELHRLYRKRIESCHNRNF